MIPRPLPSTSSFTSSNATCIPALAKFIAMPLPMVPAPITPTLLTSRSGVSFDSPRTLAASRSAKNMCRKAADCGLCMHSMNFSRSICRPSAKGRVNDTSTQSTIFCGAIWPRARFARVLRYPSSTPSGTLSATSSLVLRRGASFAASSRHQASAAVLSSPSTRWSMSPRLAACAASTGLPPVIMSSAGLAPISRGKRWVPPAPGSNPSLTSGRPTLAAGTAQR